MSLVSLFFLYTLFFFFFFLEFGHLKKQLPLPVFAYWLLQEKTHPSALAGCFRTSRTFEDLSLPLVSAHRTAALTFCSPLFSAASKLSDNSIGTMKQNRIQFFWQPAPRQARMLDAQTTLASIPRGGALAWVDFLTGAMPRRGRGTNRCTTCRNLPTPGAGIPS